MCPSGGISIRESHSFPASQTALPTAPGSGSQPLCTAEGDGDVPGEMLLCSAGALAAQEVVHALNPMAMRAEAFLGGSLLRGRCLH